MMHRSLSVLLLLLIATPALGQSVARNGDFDIVDQLDGWTIAEEPELTAEWSGLDVDGDDESGSALIGNLSANAENGVTISQCVRVQGGAGYEYGGQVRMPSGPGQSLTGRGSIAVRWASDTDCASFLGGSVGTGGAIAAFDTWIERGASTTAPIDAQSVQLRLLVSKVEAGGSLFVQFDAVYLVPQDAVFAGDFEP